MQGTPATQRVSVTGRVTVCLGGAPSYKLRPSSHLLLQPRPQPQRRARRVQQHVVEALGRVLHRAGAGAGCEGAAPRGEKCNSLDCVCSVCSGFVCVRENGGGLLSEPGLQYKRYCYCSSVGLLCML